MLTVYKPELKSLIFVSCLFLVPAILISFTKNPQDVRLLQVFLCLISASYFVWNLGCRVEIDESELRIYSPRSVQKISRKSINTVMVDHLRRATIAFRDENGNRRTAAVKVKLFPFSMEDSLKKLAPEVQ